MSFSITVLAHGAIQDTFDRHVPLWRGLNSGTHVNIIISPEDDPIDTTRTWRSARHQIMGKSQRFGPRWAACFVWLFETLAHRTDCSHHLIFEYDSVSLGPDVVEQAGISGIPITNLDLSRYLAPRFCPPPWLIEHQAMLELLRVARKYPDITEEGWGDRLFGAWAYLACVPILAFQPPGFTEERIDPNNSNHMNNLERIIRGGGRMLHGVKDEAALLAAQRFL